MAVANIHFASAMPYVKCNNDYRSHYANLTSSSLTEDLATSDLSRSRSSNSCSMCWSFSFTAFCTHNHTYTQQHTHMCTHTHTNTHNHVHRHVHTQEFNIQFPGACGLGSVHIHEPCSQKALLCNAFHQHGHIHGWSKVACLHLCVHTNEHGPCQQDM